MYNPVYQIVHLADLSRGEEPVPLEDFLIREFRAVQFNLNVHAVDYRITGEEEGSRVLRPLVGGEHLDHNLLEHLALVPVRIVQQIRGANQQSLRKKGFQIRGSRLDADLAEATVGSRGAVVLEVGRQGIEVHAGDHIEQTGEDEAEVVGMGGGVVLVGGGQFVRHRGVSPFLIFKKIITDSAPVVKHFFHIL